ncbi:MAG TPA: basic amino acid ABC transporter substrate-binding protein [Firmicutes bacterium]|jgi:polar amino acid transport system substrate-binding protein|nr:basic amino acid ABC transporter substrate-binding protein [Bacillota bacterium]HAW71738.1 basic amino acid ABC transporter substrate-binding protein [Bacillota bacterium]HAZ21714.1 basic amino acid ABC transporter substrate-binding protein [Bacillota bacterium]HBE06643.1 basic amino acid ABC transporter substrate-binding protein [Bacillota bacterium]HBG45158.1 basic amino acid ABC transporter substrate-binding protein [Bacillota bacterium]
MKNMKSKLLIFSTLVLVIALVLGISGCKKEEEKTTLIMGTEASFPPFEFTDENNEPIGFDVDLARAVAEEMGLELEVRDQPFDGLIGALQANQIDIVAAGMTITPERQETVAFSNPYYNAKQSVIVRAGENLVTSMEDLANLNIAVQMGTTGAAKAEEIKGTADDTSLKQYEKVNEAFMELTNGRVDAIIIDVPVGASYMKQFEGLEVVEAIDFEDEQFGIAVRKDNEELLNDVNTALDNIMSSGKYDELIQKWFGQ